MKTSSKFKLFTALILTTVCSPQKAQAVDQLTEENIRTFYQESLDIMSEKDSKKRFEFLNSHFHEDLIITYKIPVAANDGTLSESIEYKIDKKQFLDCALNDSENTFNAKSYEIFFISIEKDGKSARVKDKVLVSYIPDSPAFDFLTGCDDHVSLSEQGIIQVTQSTCGPIVPEEFKHPKPQ